MIKVLALLLAVTAVCPAYSLDFSLDKIKAADLDVKAEGVPAPSAPAKIEAQVPQDLVYKFNQARNEVRRLETDTTWLRNDINRLESDARRIEQGVSNPFFASDLRRMSMDMSRRLGDLQRLAADVKNLLSLAVKDAELNRVARDIEWDARDLENRFQFDIVNAAQSLEWTVRRLDPKLVGYDAQWTASDLSRVCRDLQWKTRDLSWDARDLAAKTQP
ncbi:MAG: hypothetical protein CVU79_03920 [Elusimicrobia bacterium HGW-Elusimicrobia-3]|nr:MAG: hypothetical protein CVU79_03920 [Elusimicrobia bacterium HGW-Elusimicrobia-3]